MSRNILGLIHSGCLLCGEPETPGGAEQETDEAKPDFSGRDLCFGGTWQSSAGRHWVESALDAHHRKGTGGPKQQM